MVPAVLQAPQPQKINSERKTTMGKLFINQENRKCLKRNILSSVEDLLLVLLYFYIF